MKKALIIKLADGKCAFDNFGSDSFWDEWQWKLDPFVIKSDDKSAEIVIVQEKRDETLLSFEQGSLIYTQNSHFFEWKIFALDSGEYLWRYVRRSTQEEVVSYVISKDWNRITLISDYSNSCGNFAFTGLNVLIPGPLLQNNTVTFHAALVEYNNYSFAICADSGVGKTTHARLWRDIERAIIINGDRMACRSMCTENKENHTWFSYALPWSGTSGECINRTNPLKAIVVLERGEENIATIVKGFDAFRLLFPHVLYPSWDKNISEKAMTFLEQILNDIPIIRLQCRPDEEAVAVLKSELEKL